jgi:hypothetical protein
MPSKYDHLSSMAKDSTLFEARLSDNDTQITSFCAASLAIALPNGAIFEVLLDATPTVSFKEGLYFDMTLSAYLCADDHTSEIFSSKLGLALSKEICSMKTPIRHALASKPALLAKAISAVPELQSVLDESIAHETARQMELTLKKAPSAPRRRI